MEQLEEQLEEYKQLISLVGRTLEGVNGIGQMARDLTEKYEPKPKDPLKEKWAEFKGSFATDNAWECGFEKFKRIFKEELNSTKGLDEFYEWYKFNHNAELGKNVYAEIKERFDKQNVGY